MCICAYIYVWVCTCMSVHVQDLAQESSFTYHLLKCQDILHVSLWCVRLHARMYFPFTYECTCLSVYALNTINTRMYTLVCMVVHSVGHCVVCVVLCVSVLCTHFRCCTCSAPHNTILHFFAIFFFSSFGALSISPATRCSRRVDALRFWFHYILLSPLWP